MHTFPNERRPRVVLADDHPKVLIAFGRLLRDSCDIVASVRDGGAAIEAAATLKPDVLVIDLMLPDFDGLEVCRRVKQAAPQTDVIIVTAFDDPHIETVAAQIGAGFVAKYAAATSLEPAILKLFAAQSGQASN
jgi:DNA-binding NarL/FixJ family response regulator